MDNITNFGKMVTNWLQEKLGTKKERNDLAQIFYEEISQANNAVKNLLREKQGDKPLLKTLLLTELECPIYQQNATNLNYISKDLKDIIISCYTRIQNLYEKCTKHNDNFEKFVQIYIKSGLAPTGINTYSPSKTTAYKEVKIQYDVLVISSQEIFEDCLKTSAMIESAMEALKKDAILC